MSHLSFKDGMDVLTYLFGFSAPSRTIGPVTSSPVALHIRDHVTHQIRDELAQLSDWYVTLHGLGLCPATHSSFHTCPECLKGQKATRHGRLETIDDWEAMLKKSRFAPSSRSRPLPHIHEFGEAVCALLRMVRNLAQLAHGAS